MGESALDLADVLGNNPEKTEKVESDKVAPNTRKRAKTRSESTRETDASMWNRSKRYTAADVERQDWDVDLPDPGSLPDVRKIMEPGFTYRWIRTMKAGAEDVERVLEAVNQGWEPVTAGDMPEGVVIPNMDLKGVGTCVGISSMLLCRMPDGRYAHLKSSEKDQSERQIKNIGSEIREVDSNGNAKPLKKLESQTRRGPKIQG